MLWRRASASDFIIVAIAVDVDVAVFVCSIAAASPGFWFGRFASSIVVSLVGKLLGCFISLDIGSPRSRFGLVVVFLGGRWCCRQTKQSPVSGSVNPMELEVSCVIIWMADVVFASSEEVIARRSHQPHIIVYHKPPFRSCRLMLTGHH